MRVDRDEADIQKLLRVITSGIMTDHFSLNEVEYGVSPLINIATGVVMPSDSASHLLNSYDTGTTQMMEFVKQRLNTNKVIFLLCYTKSEDQNIFLSGKEENSENN